MSSGVHGHEKTGKSWQCCELILGLRCEQSKPEPTPRRHVRGSRRVLHSGRPSGSTIGGATMPLTVRCPACRKPFTAPDAAAGKTVACPGCQQPLELPPGLPPSPTP